MTETAIKVENLSKRYRIGVTDKRPETLGGEVVSWIKTPFSKFNRLKKLSNFKEGESGEDIIWALKNVTFEVKSGEVVGVIGRNGAGKSTLLKIISRITEPTSGTVTLNGRVSSLLEVGTGFHPELTGRENIYLNGTILGMTKSEIQSKFDEIVAFSEIRKFLDTPVKRYSSGMRVRLAFAVAAHLEPEILLVDEVLAVGDFDFQKKCLRKMGDVVNEGRTILFVSHNMQAITNLCPRSIWIKGGRLHREGQSDLIVSEYLSFEDSATGKWHRSESIPGIDELELIEGRVMQSEMSDTGILRVDSSFEIEIEYKVKTQLNGCSLVIQLIDMNGTVILTSWDTDSNNKLLDYREPNYYRSSCKVPAHLLKPGKYTVTIAAHIYRKKVLDLQANAFSFLISDVGFKFNQDRQGVVNPVLDWIIKSPIKCS